MFEPIINLILTEPVFDFCIVGIIAISLSMNGYINSNIVYGYHRIFGYGSCMKCGKKRQSMWLLVCDRCYSKTQNISVNNEATD